MGEVSKSKKIKPINDSSEELEELETYIQELTAFLPLPFCIVNPTGMILNINQSFSDLTGYGDLEIVGEEIDTLFKNKEEIGSLKDRIIKEEMIKGQEMALLTKRKETILVSVSASLRKDKENNIIGYFLAFSDISELKRFQKDLEKKVEERTTQLNEKIEEMERFNKLAVGRELKMVELKEENDELKRQLGKFRDASSAQV